VMCDDYVSMVMLIASGGDVVTSTWLSDEECECSRAVRHRRLLLIATLSNFISQSQAMGLDFWLG
jgi:hypothetical protein